MTARRSFLARFGAAAAALTLGSANASAQPSSPERWQPVRDAKDDWFDQIPGKHRLFFDTLTSQGVSEAMGFADNYFTGSKSGYDLDTSDVAVVICLRHMSTLFAFGDPFWAKYGAAAGDAIKFNDPKTSQAPIVNVYKARLDGMIKRGVHFAVCDMASHRFATAIARKIDSDAETVFKDMAASLLGNGHFVAAGIIAVNRAQERGYSIAYTG